MDPFFFPHSFVVSLPLLPKFKIYAFPWVWLIQMYYTKSNILGLRFSFLAKVLYAKIIGNIQEFKSIHIMYNT